MAAHDPKRPGSFFDWFVHSQVAGSVVLIVAAVLALILANTPLKDFYKTVAHLDLGFVVAGATYTLHLDHWVKDGLMAIFFFFVVGLEIKREVVVGELATFEKAILPVGAAIGGAMVPAAIYLSFSPQGRNRAAGPCRWRPTSPLPWASWRCSANACRSALRSS